MGSFGYNLKKLRKDKRLSQKNLAEMIGVGQTTIANYENDLRFPNPPVLAQMADILDVSLDALIGRVPKKEALDFDLADYTKRFIKLVFAYQEAAAIEMVVDLAKKGYDPILIHEHFLKPTLYEVGRLWEKGQISIPMEHHITNVIDRIIVLLSPYIECKEDNHQTAIFLAPNNEPHLIGLKMVKEIFKKFGWKTLYVGNSVPWQSLVNWIEEHQVDLVVITATMQDNRNQIQAMVDFLRQSTKVKVMIGGQAYALKDYFIDQVKPDYYTSSYEDLNELLNQIS